MPREVRVEERVLPGRVAQVHDLSSSLVAAEALDDSIRDGHDRRPARRGQVDRMVLLLPAAPGEERVAVLRAVERLERQREIRREELRELALGDRDRTAVRLAHDEAGERLREVLPEREMRRVHRRFRAGSVPRVFGFVRIVRIFLGDVGSLRAGGPSDPWNARATRGPPRRPTGSSARLPGRAPDTASRAERAPDEAPAEASSAGGGSRLEEHRDRGRSRTRRPPAPSAPPRTAARRKLRRHAPDKRRRACRS